MKMDEILKQRGLEKPDKEKPKGEFAPRRRYFWTEGEEGGPLPDQETAQPQAEAKITGPAEASPAPKIEEKKAKKALQRISRDNLEKNLIISREEPSQKTISREYPSPHLESLQRVSRESLEKNACDLTRIVGLQKKVLFVIFSILQSKGSRVTPPIAIGLISERASTTIANAQNAIKELIKKGVLLRKEFQRGRGGWTIYEIEPATFAQLDQEKTRESLESLQRFSSIEMGAKSRETAPSSKG